MRNRFGSAAARFVGALLVGFGLNSAYGAAYEDAYIETDDASARLIVNGAKRVYVITNTAALGVTLKTKKSCKLVEYLVVGGGGAGGPTVGGGGGGGGVVYDATTKCLSGGTRLTVTVGKGGLRGSTASTMRGGDTTFAFLGTNIVAYGSGGGNGWNGPTGTTGASTGGSTSNRGGDGANPLALDPPQGHCGGRSVGGLGGNSGVGCGGGGYSEAGGNSYKGKRIVDDTEVSYAQGGKGGDGFTCSITGEAHTYGSGGGGAAGWANTGGNEIYNLPGEGGLESGGRGGHTTLDHGNVNLDGVNGTDGMGGGGGGEGHNGNLSVSKKAGNGGSGTLILALRDLEAGDKALAVDAIPSQIVTGNEIRPVPVVRDALSGDLLADSNYAVSYSDNVYPGIGSVVVTGKGDYAGVVAVGEFKIVQNRRFGKDVYLFLGGANMCAAAAAGGPALAVSNIMANAEADVEVVVVNTSVSASKLSTWVRGGANYTATVTAAQAAAQSGSVRAIFWMQGEEDAATADVRDAYAATVAALVADLKNDLSLDDSIPFIAATVPETSSTGVNNCRALNEKIRTIPDVLANAYVVEGRDLLLNAYNVKTFCAESTRTLGLRMANAFFEHERRHAKGRLAVAELGPQAISGSDTIAPAVKVTDTNGAVVASSNYDVTYRGTAAEGFGVAVVAGKAGTDYAGMTNFAPFRVMCPVFVAPDGDPDEDGSTWAKATTFDHAVTLANGTKEVWLKKGDYAWTSAYSMTMTMFVRGGFEGVAGDRVDGNYSVLDGGRTIGNILTGTHTGNPGAATYKTFLERIDFRGATGTLVYHPGSGTALIRDCLFSNASAGLSADGCYGQQNIAVWNCRFFNIILPDTTWGAGKPVNIGNVGNALVENCLFVSNGVPWTHAIPSGTLHGQGRMIAIGNNPCDVIGCEFRANRMTASVGNGSSCIYIYNTPGRRLRVERCLFAGNELVGRSKNDGQWGGSVNSGADSGMILLFAHSSNYTLDILNCTFAYNTIDNGSAAAVSVITGKAYIRNSIFFGNVSSTDNLTGSDIVLQTNRDDWNAYADIAYCLFAEDNERYFFAGRCGEFIMDRSTMVFGDPLFVTPQSTVTNLLRNTTTGSATTSATRWRSNFAFKADCQDQVAAFDCHLRSGAGTRLNDGSWVKFAAQSSPALDKGDPTADCRFEPTPNGARLNLGYYGGTASATKTLEAFPGLEDDTIDISFPGGISQPHLDFTVVDTEGGSFSADVTVLVGTQDGWTVSNAYASVAAGTPFHVVVPDCYSSDKTLKVRVIIAAGGKTVTVNAEKAVSGSLSPYYDIGGGSGIFHVRPGATGRGDGSDWFHAFPGDLHDAVRYLAKLEDSSNYPEMWCAMRTNALTEAKAALNPATALVIRGGFTGFETSADARPGWKTVCVAGGLRTPVVVANTVPLTLERFEFTDGAGRGFEKSAAGDLTLKDCRFFGNIKSGEISGRGVYATGSSGSTVLTITNCVFEGNSNTDLGTAADVYSGYGHALYVSSFKRVVIDDSLFLTNGLIWNVANPRSGCARMGGSAIYASSAPLTVRRSQFRGNRGGTSRSVGEGGIVSLNAGTAGSAFTNCLFVGNHESWHQNSGPGAYSGALKINTGNTNVFVSVCNCTFFGNLADGTANAAGVNVASGAARIENSLFNGNLLGASKAGEYAADMVVAADARAVVRYTLFSASDSVRAKVGGDLDLDSSVFYGDAQLVTATSNTVGITQQTHECTVFKPSVREAVLQWDVHPRSPAGTCLNDGTWTNFTDDVSVAIDNGDPNAPYALEPAPNGSRLNLGCYGNTPEASKKMESHPAILDDKIDVTFPNGITQPKISFTVVDTKGGPFSAVVTVYVGTGTVETVVQVIGDVKPGDSICVVPTECYEPGATLNVRVVVEAAGAFANGAKSVTVAGQISPYYGKGGTDVYHVRPGATGRNDGSDWFHAFNGTFQEAMSRGAASVTEYWVAAGTNTVDRNYGSIVRSNALVIRGGFAGTESHASERRPGAFTVVDGANAYTPLSIGSVPSVVLDALSFENGKQQGLYKEYEGDLTLVDCRFVRNGQRYDGAVAGRGAFLKGTYLNVPTATPSTLTLTRCLFADNYGRDAYENSTVDSGTGGAYLWNWKRVVMDDCVFTNNCNKFDFSTTSSGCNNQRGAAFWAKNAPVTVRNCRFCFNHGATGNSSDFGGIVALAGGTGGSAFTNCLFMGNVEQWHMGQKNGSGSGALRIETGDTEHPVDVQNCTVFANLSDGGSCSAGINVRSGAVKIRNSIVFANTVGYCRKADAADDLLVQTNAVADIAYTLFTSRASVTNRLGGTVTFGEGVQFGDAQLVTAYAEVTNAIENVSGSQGQTTWFKPAARADVLNFNAHLRGRCGYYDASGRWTRTPRGKSPALDAGDPASPYANEPDTELGGNGGRVNLGCYGNTPQATLSPIRGAFLRVR